jgi:hypothetical protein
MNEGLRRSVFVLLATSLIAVLPGCATVPKEVVELSYRMGEDMSALQESYGTLVHEHFEALRRERIRYLDEEWTPRYLRAWIVDGRLRDVAKGEVIWSEEGSDFVKPVPGKEEEGLLTTIRFWSQSAVDDIEKKKTELLGPLTKQERQLSLWVADAFNRLYRGNAAITAHLNSLRKVQEVQDDMLAALNLKDVRDKINNALATASDKAQQGLDEVRKADGLVQEAKKVLPKQNDTNK